MLLIIESESVGINLEREDLIPQEDHILLVSSDLQARARVEAAAGARGLRVEVRRPEAPPASRDAPPPAALILDLDQIKDPAAWLDAPLPPRVLGFYAHVREDTATAARAAGIEVYPRSRFWRELTRLLGG